MLKRLFCTVFLAVFCLGNAAYAASDETIAKYLENSLRKELTGWVHETVRQECRQAGVAIPRKIVIHVAGYNREMCGISLEFSSYVPDEAVKRMARHMAVTAADILKDKGWCHDGMLVMVLPTEFGHGVQPYDGQFVLNVRGKYQFKTMPKEDIMPRFDRMSE